MIKNACAMLSKEEKARYSKQIILPEIGVGGQHKLKSARVLVVGAGGLGCPVLQYLAAAGVGTIGIADGDVVDISNLQRQVLYHNSDIGKPKATVAAERIAAINPEISVVVHPAFLDSENALEIIRDYDIVVDGSDNFDARYLINDACVMLGKPMVSGAIYKFEGQVSVFNYQGGPTYRCLFPEPPGAGASPNCADIGVVATLPGIIGTIQANEVIKVITGIGDVLTGRLLVIDTLTMDTHSFSFKLNPANLQVTELPVTLCQQCTVEVGTIAYDELLDLLNRDSSVQLVDVREEDEHAIDNIGGRNIPLSGFEQNIRLLDKMQPVVVYCASGVRSEKSVTILVESGFAKVYNLMGGLTAVER